MDAEMLEAVKDIYISTTLAVVEDFDSFTYDAENDVFVSTADIVYSVTVMGTSATITASNAKVKLDADKNIAEIACDMKQEYMDEGVKDELIMKVTFTFTDYGTTVVNVPAENE